MVQVVFGSLPFVNISEASPIIPIKVLALAYNVSSFFICRQNGVVTGTAQCRQNIVNSFSGSLGHDACLGVRESDICRNLIWSRKGSYSIHLQELFVLFGAVMVCRTLIWQGDGEGTKSMQLRPGLVRRILKEAEALFFALRCGAVQDQYCKFLSRYLQSLA